MKHLWEISDWIYPEVTMNHGEKGYFDSWENYVKSGADGCNCIFGNPVVHWGWRREAIEEDEEENILQLLFFTWSGTSVEAVHIRVTDKDEDLIRAYLKKNSSFTMWTELGVE